MKSSFQVLVAFALSFMGLGSNPCCGDALLIPYPLSWGIFSYLHVFIWLFKLKTGMCQMWFAVFPAAYLAGIQPGEAKCGPSGSSSSLPSTDEEAGLYLGSWYKPVVQIVDCLLLVNKDDYISHCLDEDTGKNVLFRYSIFSSLSPY